MALRRAIGRHRSVPAALRALVRESPAAAAALHSEYVRRRVARGLETIQAQKIAVITYRDERYPARLKHLKDPPYALFARGRLELLNRLALAVVGSRRCSEYGVDTTRALTTPAARAGVVIVSGLALGIDGVAHEAALDAGGDTIAVLGCGIDICYPRSHRGLYERIARDGLLLSEFPPGMEPYPYHFPQRNRIIALLASAVLVVEASADSGSLITAEHAWDHMDVLAVPGPIGRPTSEGTNLLISDGAQIALSAADVFEALHLQPSADTEPDELPPAAVAGSAHRVWRALSSEAVHVDELAARLSLPTGTVALSLLELELAGCARQLPGGRFALPARRV